MLLSLAIPSGNQRQTCESLFFNCIIILYKLIYDLEKSTIAKEQEAIFIGHVAKKGTISDCLEWEIEHF
jgi:hypothetical protein